jgi:hypothetical protein
MSAAKRYACDPVAPFLSGSPGGAIGLPPARVSLPSRSGEAPLSWRPKTMLMPVGSVARSSQLQRGGRCGPVTRRGSNARQHPSSSSGPVKRRTRAGNIRDDRADAPRGKHHLVRLPPITAPRHAPAAQ